jgi:hypothetical protein
MKKIFTLTSLAVIGAMSLAACSGGGAGSNSGSSNSLLPSGPSTSSTAKSKASISFNVPKANPGNNIGTSSVSTQAVATRKPMEISPATDKFALMIDGVEIVKDVEVANYNNAGIVDANGNSVALAVTSFSSYFTVTATMTTTPGSHLFGVVLKSGNPAYVLSEAQATYTLVPTFSGQSAQTLGTLTLLPAMGSGYIECDTFAENSGSPAGSCNNGQNFINGVYYLTAVAADYDGFPIVSQGSTAFDNGSYSVVETDGNGIVTLGSNGPFSSPGSWLTGPSSSWVDSLDPGATFQYGNRFTATCNKVGTASLALQLTAQIYGNAPLSPITGYNYNFINSYSPLANGAFLPLGSKTTAGPGTIPANPQYNVTVNCSAVATLPLD